MIALAIVAFVLAAASTFFIGVVKQYKVQSKITESNVEGVIGLELMRQDIESLGFGLPWDLNGYTSSEPGLPSSTDPPRAVGSGNGGGYNSSDNLVIRSARVGMASAAGKWTTLRSSSPFVRMWEPAEENLISTDQVIVLSPGGANRPSRVLLTNLGTAFSNVSTYAPSDSFQTNIVYGIDSGTVPLVRPFNRADYYIADNADYRTPAHCAQHTGVLVKATIAQDGSITKFPLLDCIADLQVVYGLDNNSGGEVNYWTDTLGILPTAADIRTQLKELRVHVLAQVGQRDNSYAYPSTNVDVGQPGAGGRNFNFATSSITDYGHYRWKVYNIVVKPKNLSN
jgi:hypothetical protein